MIRLIAERKEAKIIVIYKLAYLLFTIVYLIDPAFIGRPSDLIFCDVTLIVESLVVDPPFTHGLVFSSNDYGLLFY